MAGRTCHQARRGHGVCQPIPPDCPAELIEKMCTDVLVSVERRRLKRHHEVVTLGDA